MISTTERPRGATTPWSPLKSIVVGGFLAGLADFTYAMVYFGGIKGAPPIKIWQSVAAGLIGASSYDGGTATFALGLGLHWLIAFIWATVFVFVATRFLPSLLRRPIPYGLAYGAFVYGWMNYVVLPLDAMHTHVHYIPLTWWTGLAVHMFGIGLAISLSAAKTSPRA